MIWKLEEHGHDVKITAKEKDVALNLLEAYGFAYESLGKVRSGMMKKAVGMLDMDRKLYSISKVFDPDIFVSTGSPYAAQVSKLLGKPHVAFSDTEFATLIFKLMKPITNVICTPSCFKKDLGERHIRYNGYHEIAYLHPRYYKPNNAILKELGLSRDEKYYVLRFVSWEASHDLQGVGFDKQMKMELIKELEKTGKVFISSETRLEKSLEKYRIAVPPVKMHDLLNFAAMYVGEGLTMATEAALLGTPSILVSSNAKLAGVFDDLRDNFGLVYYYDNGSAGLEKTYELLKKNPKKAWLQKRDKLLKSKIDVTEFMVEFVEDFPESFYKYKQDNQ
jgi:predicted glycosyltransferase